jgi:PAS domain S-box-containing protein
VIEVPVSAWSVVRVAADVGGALSVAGTLGECLKKCTEALVRHLDVAFARIWTLNESAQALDLEASAGVYSHIDGAHGRVPVGRFKIGRIAQECQPHLTNDVLTDDWVSDPEWARQQGMVAFAGYPLVLEGRAVGVIAAFARRPISETVIVDLASVAGRIAQFVKRERSEDSLRLSEEQFRQLAENIHEVFFIAEPEPAGLTYLSPAFEEIWGQPRHEVYERADAWIESIHPEDRDQATSIFVRSFRGERADGEYRIVRPDGSVRFIKARAFPVGDTQGRFCRVVGIAEDVTDNKRAEETLRASEERYREIFENASDLIFTIDLGGRLTSLNRATEQTIGYSRKEIARMDAPQLAGPQSVNWVAEIVERSLAGEPDAQLEVEFRAKDGRRVLLEVKTHLIQKGGKPVGVQGVGRDITGRDAAEVELRHAQKLESLGRLASGIAHEINTPIQFVGDNTRFLQDSFGSLQTLLAEYQEFRDDVDSGAFTPELLAKVRETEEKSDCAYLLEEIPKALTQTLDGVTRVATIVRAMKDFAHPESQRDGCRRPQ